MDSMIWYSFQQDELNFLLWEATHDSPHLTSFHESLKNPNKRNLMGNLCASRYAKVLTRESLDLASSKVSFLSEEEEVTILTGNLVEVEPDKSRKYYLAIPETGKRVKIAMGPSSRDYQAREKVNEFIVQEFY